MKQKDVVIAGGGIGGLASAVMLAQAGHKVTLFEKEPHVGGYSVAFRRGGFSFDVSLHAIPGGGSGSSFERIAARLGISDRITFVKFATGPWVFFGSQEFVIPNGLEPFLQKLREEFPAERDGLDLFQKEVTALGSLYLDVVDCTASFSRIAAGFVPRLPTFLRHTVQSTEAYLSRFFREKPVKALLYQASIFYGIPMTNFPAVNFILMFYMLFTQGMYGIRGGGQALVDALSARLAELGATIRVKSAVDRILVANNRANGVRTADGNEHHADAVVCNVNLPALVNTLVGKEAFGPSYCSTLGKLGYSLSTLQVFLGLECPLAQAGIRHHITSYFPDADLDAHVRRQQSSLFVEGFSIIAPDIAEAETTNHACSVIGGVSSERWCGLGRDEYAREKALATEDLVDKVERLLPGIRSRIVVREAATPRTFERYTANPLGAFMGFAPVIGAQRKIMKVSKLPIGNLYLASAWTDKLGGFLQATKAGMAAAEKIIRSAK